MFGQYRRRSSDTGDCHEISLTVRQNESPSLLLYIVLSSVVKIYITAAFYCASSGGIDH